MVRNLDLGEYSDAMAGSIPFVFLFQEWGHQEYLWVFLFPWYHLLALVFQLSSDKERTLNRVVFDRDYN